MFSKKLYIHSNFKARDVRLIICVFLLNFSVISQESFENLPKSKIRFTSTINLYNKLNETSGLIKWNGTFWTHNDDTDTNLYALDTVTGAIVGTYPIPNVTNIDWEELQQDENHLYIGDFGNNAKGNRTDLHILKIEKNSLLARNPIAEKISFKYENQTSFNSQVGNTTNFDCEAFVVTKDSLYLFSKEWTSKKTTLFVLPKFPGDYIAKPKGSFKIKGLVTGASLVKQKNTLALCGYTRNGRPFISFFYNFIENNFLSGLHKKIKIKPRFQQIEAISSEDGVHYFLTSEKLKFLTINRSQQLLLLDLRKI